MKSTPWNIIILSRGQGSSQLLPPLKCTNSSIYHISHILETVKILLHRVTTHKIQIVPRILTSLILKVLQSLAFPLHVSTQHLDTKELFPLLLLLLHYFSQTQLIITSLLLLGTIPGKVPCFITTKTYYF